MDNTIRPGLLNDTYQLVQLARESALAQGKQAQVDKLSPVVQDLKSLVNNTQETQPVTAPTHPDKIVQSPAPATGMMGQSDFQELLNAAQTAPAYQNMASSTGIAERNQMVRSMAAGNMLDVEIARSMGISREEVHLILSIGGK